jgi:conjugal transfer mating pair stabilization protein TraG
MASYWLPLMKNAFEAIMYGSFLIVFLLMLFPFGMMILRNYLFTLLWLQMWAPLFAIIHLMMSFYARSRSLAVSPDAFTLQSLPGLLQVNADMAGLAGYLSLSVPFLAGGLVKGMSGTFTQLAQYIGGVTQSAGSSAAAEVVSGNLSMGNTNFSNHSAFNTSANHWDTSAKESSGHFSYQMPSGSTATLTALGTSILDNRGAISSLGTSVNLAGSMRSLYSQQSEDAISTAQSEAQTYSQSTSSTFRSLYDLSNQHGFSTTSGSGSTVNRQGGFTQALSNFHQIIDKIAHDNNLSTSEATQVASSVYAQLQLSGGWKSEDSLSGKIGALLTGLHGNVEVSAGGKVEGQHTSVDQRGDLYARAAEYLKNSQFSSSVDTVLHGIQEKSVRTQNDIGQRLVDGISSSWDRANQARHEMVANYQKSESLRHMASYAEENAVNINANYSQRLFEFVAKQPGTNGKGHMGMSSVDQIFLDPELARPYVQDFIRQESSLLLSGAKNNITTPSSIREEYEHQRSTVSGSAATVSQSMVDRKQIADTNTAKHLSDPHFIDNAATVQANNIIQSAVQSGNKEHQRLDKQVSDLQTVVNKKNEE